MDHSKPPPFELLTARAMTMDSYPDIAQLPQKHSSGSGLHEIDFVGDLCYWSEFPTQVREAFQKVQWGDNPVSARLRTQDLNYSENFYCGAEISTSARYITHVLNPVGGIAKELSLNIRSGDWGISGVKLQWPNMPVQEDKKDKSSIPDYALVDVRTKELRALGEAKHPWGTAPDSYVEEARTGDNDRTKQLRRFLGQVSRDMWAAKVKLAFMTNYTWTVFIRREKIENKWVLFFSDAIHHATKSSIGTSTVSPSVRECMLYYFKLAAGERSNWSLELEQQEPLQDWVRIKERVPGKRSQPALLQQKHRIPSGASLEQPATNASKAMQLPHRSRNPDQGQSKSDPTAAKQSQYKNQHDQSPPGALQETGGKDKAKLHSSKPPTGRSSSTNNTRGEQHQQSQPSRASPKTVSKPAATYNHVGRVQAGWESYKHKGVDLPKSQWRKVGNCYYHDTELLQIEEGT